MGEWSIASTVKLHVLPIEMKINTDTPLNIVRSVKKKSGFKSIPTTLYQAFVKNALEIRGVLLLQQI